MKKTLLAVALLALMLVSATPYAAHKLIRLTVVNKSGLPVEIQLTGSCNDNWYYLRIPKGDIQFPFEQVFTIVPDVYALQAYYVELWDPVYGYSCSARAATINATRNLKVMVPECNRTPSVPGEASIVKLGAIGGRGQGMRR
ncbi:MAG: hypothetical protein JXA78_19870 [Anaerolineales bacterium]|nr:hypothetical protein [Anaerolineales bacterium]